MNSSLWKKITLSLLIVFAVIGFGLTSVYVAVRFGWTNTSGIIDLQREAFLNNQNSAAVSLSEQPVQDWQETPEWATLKAAIVKDQGVINRAAATAGVPPRLIVENLVAEQLRFFFDDRSSYEKFFAPLKILGSQTQFSWGVMGMKEDTAVQVENNLKDSTLPFYLGNQYENLLNFQTTNVVQERFTRMTDQHDHFYSYLYAGLYIHEIENQWSSAGFDISNRPDILATLYNVGFTNSKPNADPKSGGAAIPVWTQTWSFGALAQSFYDSNELTDEFPK